MKDIKERVRDKNPKIRNPAARLPKELVRSAVLEAKEKPRELHEKSSGQSESPTQYGTEKIESVQYRAASVAGKSIGKTTYQGGKKLAGVTYRKIKERKSRQEEAKAAEEAMEQGAESGKKLIKLKPEQAALAKENGKRQVKAAPRVVKVSGLSQEKIKTQASMQKQQMEKSLQARQLLGDHGVDARVLQPHGVDHARRTFGDAGRGVPEARIARGALERERTEDVDIVKIPEFVAVSERTAGRNDRVVQLQTAQGDGHIRGRFSCRPVLCDELLSYHMISPFVNTGPSLQMRLLPYLVLHEQPMQAPKPQPMRSSNESCPSCCTASHNARSIGSGPQA